MGYLRTNYRITGKELDFTAFGEVMKLGSWLGSAGTRREGGGLIMGSYGGSLSVDGILVISALGAMSAYYGSGLFGEGYRIQPFYAYANITFPGTISIYNQIMPTFSHDGSLAYIKVYLGSEASVAEDMNSGLSAGVKWVGFIVSTP